VVCTADMQMTCEKHIGAASRELLQRHPCAPDEVALVFAAWQFEGVMRNDYLDNVRPNRAEPFSKPGYLRFVYAPALERQRTGCVYAKDCNLVVDIGWLEVIGNMAPVLLERVREPRKDIVKGDIVIPGHNDLGARKRIQKRSRLRELIGPRPLRQVTGYHDKIRCKLSYRLNERIDDLLIDGTVMEV